MPVLGFGTYLFPKETVGEQLKTAILDYGYRQIDTASMYENEEEIGTALQECFSRGIAREEIFITTKLWISDRDKVE